MSRARILLAIAAVLAIFLVGCGPDDTASEPSNGTDEVSVLPDLVDKQNLPPNPDDEVNVALAPEMPPRPERDTPAFVDVEFEVVENVSTIDPKKGTQHETWGYRIVSGPDTTVVGTPPTSSWPAACCGESRSGRSI